jgi:hypothetical protein
MRQLLIAAGALLCATSVASAQGYGPPPPPPGGGPPQPAAAAHSQFGADVMAGFGYQAWTSPDRETLSGSAFSLQMLGGFNLSNGRRIGLWLSYASGSATGADSDIEFDTTSTLIGLGVSNASLLGGKFIFRVALGVAGHDLEFMGESGEGETGFGTLFGFDIKLSRNISLFLTGENSFFFPEDTNFQRATLVLGVAAFTPYSEKPVSAPAPGPAPAY